MPVDGGSKVSGLEWFLAGVVVVLAMTITSVAGVGEKWQNAVVYTVLLFTALIIALRPAWSRKRFWHDLTLIFLLHTVAAVVVEQASPPGSEGPHGLPLTLAGMAEGVLIAGVLWKRSMRSNSHRS